MIDFDLPPLIPCPNCGERPYSGKSIDYFGKIPILYPFVRCGNCGREVIGKDSKTVFEEWNKV